MTGALIVIGSILLGMGYATTQGFDGAQTLIACLFVWLCLQALRYGVLAFAPRRRRR